jgi:hypothetical protein
MSYEHCDKHDMPATNGCEACAVEQRKAQRDELVAKIHAQMIRDGVDPEHLTLDQAWSYFCFNVEV